MEEETSQWTQIILTKTRKFIDTKRPNDDITNSLNSFQNSSFKESNDIQTLYSIEFKSQNNSVEIQFMNFGVDFKFENYFEKKDDEMEEIISANNPEQTENYKTIILNLYNEQTNPTSEVIIMIMHMLKIFSSNRQNLEINYQNLSLPEILINIDGKMEIQNNPNIILLQNLNNMDDKEVRKRQHMWDEADESYLYPSKRRLLNGLYGGYEFQQVKNNLLYIIHTYIRGNDDDPNSKTLSNNDKTSVEIYNIIKDFNNKTDDANKEILINLLSMALNAIAYKLSTLNAIIFKDDSANITNDIFKICCNSENMKIANNRNKLFLTIDKSITNKTYCINLDDSDFVGFNNTPDYTENDQDKQANSYKKIFEQSFIEKFNEGKTIRMEDGNFGGTHTSFWTKIIPISELSKYVNYTADVCEDGITMVNYDENDNLLLEKNVTKYGSGNNVKRVYYPYIDYSEGLSPHFNPPFIILLEYKNCKLLTTLDFLYTWSQENRMLNDEIIKYFTDCVTNKGSKDRAFFLPTYDLKEQSTSQKVLSSKDNSKVINKLRAEMYQFSRINWIRTDNLKKVENNINDLNIFSARMNNGYSHLYKLFEKFYEKRDYYFMITPCVTDINSYVEKNSLLNSNIINWKTRVESVYKLKTFLLRRATKYLNIKIDGRTRRKTINISNESVNKFLKIQSVKISEDNETLKQLKRDIKTDFDSQLEYIKKMDSELFNINEELYLACFMDIIECIRNGINSDINFLNDNFNANVVEDATVKSKINYDKFDKISNEDINTFLSSSEIKNSEVWDSISMENIKKILKLDNDNAEIDNIQRIILRDKDGKEIMEPDDNYFIGNTPESFEDIINAINKNYESITGDGNNNIFAILPTIDVYYIGCSGTKIKKEAKQLLTRNVWNGWNTKIPFYGSDNNFKNILIKIKDFIVNNLLLILFIVLLILIIVYIVKKLPIINKNR